MVLRHLHGRRSAELLLPGLHATAPWCQHEMAQYSMQGIRVTIHSVWQTRCAGRTVCCALPPYLSIEFALCSGCLFALDLLCLITLMTDSLNPHSLEDSIYGELCPSPTPCAGLGSPGLPSSALPGAEDAAALRAALPELESLRCVPLGHRHRDAGGHDSASNPTRGCFRRPKVCRMPAFWHDGQLADDANHRRSGAVVCRVVVPSSAEGGDPGELLPTRLPLPDLTSLPPAADG